MPLTMTRRVVTFKVSGEPQTQGSMRAFTPKGLTRPILTSTNRNLKGWRQLVSAQAQTVAQDGLFVGPVAIGVVFQLPRPQSLPKRVLHHVKRPDVDKLLRAVLDSLTHVLYHDDGQVVRVTALKVYAAPATPPGVIVTVAEAAAPPAVQTEFTLEELFTEEDLHAQA